MLVARPQQLRMLQKGYIANQNSIINAQMRAFAKKKKKSTPSDEETVEDATVEEAPVEAQEAIVNLEPAVEEPIVDDSFAAFVHWNRICTCWKCMSNIFFFFALFIFVYRTKYIVIP